MHYCGPREALHHLNLREKFGFNVFTIGRDHAGAENNIIHSLRQIWQKKM